LVAVIILVASWSSSGCAQGGLKGQLGPQLTREATDKTPDNFSQALSLWRSARTTLQAAAKQPCYNAFAEQAVLLGDRAARRLEEFAGTIELPPGSGFSDGNAPNSPRAQAEKRKAQIGKMIDELRDLIAQIISKPACETPNPPALVDPGPTPGPGPTPPPEQTPIPDVATPQGNQCTTADQLRELKRLEQKAKSLRGDLIIDRNGIKEIDDEIERLTEKKANPKTTAQQRVFIDEDLLELQRRRVDRVVQQDEDLRELLNLNSQIRALGGQECPPPGDDDQSYVPRQGLYGGGELVTNWGRVDTTERRAGTDAVTNRFSDRGDTVGGGILLGYKFTPWANRIVVSPFASFDVMRSAVNHTFAGGSSLGTTANFMGTVGVKIGPQLDLGPWIYGIAGVSVLNQTLNINFIPGASSKSVTVAGATVGAGVAVQPSFLRAFGLPVSVFAEYQHTWWQDANFNAPAASPAFNYNFRRQDDLVKIGFTVPLFIPPPARPPLSTVSAPGGGPKHVKTRRVKKN